MKKIISVLLSALLLLAPSAVSFAASEQAEPAGARLFAVYGDSMIFEQNQKAAVRGVCASGAVITVELLNESGEIAAKGKATAPKSGEFSVSFDAPGGGYSRYTLKVYENGVLFSELHDVVFGEVWLASGQSNMSFSLAAEKTGAELKKNGAADDEWLRVLYIPEMTAYNGSTSTVPADPLKDAEGAYWMKGGSAKIYGMSAVAYFFAEALREKLDMPVGVLDAALGGSSIGAWLSRAAVDSDPEVKKDFENGDIYIDYDKWYDEERNQAFDLASQFNLKISPLAPFRISGMIWYQGETDIMFGWEKGRYSRAFDLLQRSYTEHFGYEKGLLPVVFTSIASQQYFSDRDYDLSIQERNIEFTGIQQARPESRALMAIYDVPFDYSEALGSIHPICKKPVGERMAYCAMGLVYGKSDTYTAATVSGAQIKDSSVYVTFRNTGAGLDAGADLCGFSVCAADGIYVPAKAQVISPDTVRVYSPLCSAPVSAAYAYMVDDYNCNLFAVDENGNKIPAAGFETAAGVGTHYYADSAWAKCDSAESWHIINPFDMVGYYADWEAKNAGLAFGAQHAFEGSGGMGVTSSAKKFTVSPVLNYHRYNRDYFLDDTEHDWSDYGTLSFMVRNNGSEPVSADSLRFYVDSVVWYSAKSVDGDAVIPADGQWHQLSFDLNSLSLLGRENGAVYSNEKLQTVQYIKINFSAEGESDLSIDGFTVTADGGDTSSTEYPAFSLADRIIELFCNLISKIYNLIYKDR